MWTCRICRFAIELDDVVVAKADGRCLCLCLRCLDRATGGARRMATRLRHDLAAALGPEVATGRGGR